MTNPARLRFCSAKPRIVVTTDISNEPDDAESMVRYLLYTNEFETLGLVACTSFSLKDHVCPEDIQRIIEAYAKVVDNLNAHVHPENQYPSASHLLSLVKTGPTVYGRLALTSEVPLSSGSAAIIDGLDTSDEPLWVLCWGGANVLAQALYHLQRTRSEDDFKHLRSKLRVYAISDQDDTGIWIRLNFPDIFYICSVHGWNQYAAAGWQGMSGELSLPSFDEGGPDTSVVDRSWLKKHVQIGPLGSVYPDYTYGVEGDTPSFLNLIQNGLASPEHPHWGGWGGRHLLVDISGMSNHYADSRDIVIGKNGKRFSSTFATIWRWRKEYQNDFAARMQWTLHNDRTKANHAPVVIVNGSTAGPETLYLEAEAGSDIALDASRSYDPDGDNLTFHWFHYTEPTKAHMLCPWLKVVEVEFKPVDDGRTGTVVQVTLPPAEISAVEPLSGQPLGKGQVLHFILEVKDDGVPALVTYKRVVVQITNNSLQGGSGKIFKTMSEALGHRVR